MAVTPFKHDATLHPSSLAAQRGCGLPERSKTKLIIYVLAFLVRQCQHVPTEPAIVETEHELFWLVPHGTGELELPLPVPSIAHSSAPI